MESNRTAKDIISKWERSRRFRQWLTTAGVVLGVAVAAILGPFAMGGDPPWAGRIVGVQTIDGASGPVMLVYRARFGQVHVQAMVPGGPITPEHADK